MRVRMPNSAGTTYAPFEITETTATCHLCDFHEETDLYEEVLTSIRDHFLVEHPDAIVPNEAPIKDDGYRVAVGSQIECLWCKEPMHAGHVTKKFCSEACRKKYRRSL